MLHIIYNGSLLDHILEEVDAHKVSVEFNKSWIIRVLRKLLYRNIKYIPFIRPYIYNANIYKELYKIRSNDIVLVLDRILPSELWSIRNSIPKDSKCIMWFWNPLRKTYRSNDIEPNINFIKSLGYTIFTFDLADARLYNLGYKHQFGRMPARTEFHDNEPSNDFYFMGAVKDRSEDINSVKELLVENGFTVDFHCITGKDAYMPYIDNISNILKCKCIVDINQKTQIGLTMRPLEALFYRKKLLTNNISIRNYNFYKEQNIFILGYDSKDRLNSFINTPYEDIPLSIVEEYDINYWLQEFEI